MSTTYRIGILAFPEPDDPTFDSQADAEIAAIQMSYNDSVIAVWDADDGEIVALVYQMTVYAP